MGERVFIDPVLHSARLDRVRTGALVGLSGMAFGLIVGLGRANGYSLQSLLMAASAVAAAMGLGYYIQTRTRMALRQWCWLKLDDFGLTSMLPSGEVRIGWDEIDEVRVSFRAARGRGMDLMIMTRRGCLRAAMRFVERDGPRPEPLLRFGGARLRWPDGTETEVGPEHSPLLDAIRERLPPRKIKLGAMFTP